LPTNNFWHKFIDEMFLDVDNYYNRLFSRMMNFSDCYFAWGEVKGEILL